MFFLIKRQKQLDLWTKEKKQKIKKARAIFFFEKTSNWLRKSNWIKKIENKKNRMNLFFDI